MSTGIAIPATNAPGYEAREAIERAGFDREQQKAHYIELGAATLGYHQLPIRQDGATVGYAWQPRQPAQIAGLPAGLVNAARQALQAETAARDALLTTYAESRSYIAQHQLSDQAARVHSELHSAEAASAHRAAVAATPRALHALGQVAEEAQQIRAVINAAPARRAQIEAQYQTQLAQLDADVQRARNRARELGLT